MEFVTTHCGPTRTGGLVTSFQIAAEERLVADWRLKPCAFVLQERTTLLAERVIFNNGNAGLSFTVTLLLAKLLVDTGSEILLVTLAALVNTPLTVVLTKTVAVAELPLFRLEALKVTTPLFSDHDPFHCADKKARPDGKV